jgi:hypothetical protein
VFQRGAVQELHGNERFPVLFADVVNRADVGVIQGGGGLGFATKAGQCVLILRYMLRQKCKGYETVEARVLGFVDNAHPAATKLLDDAVMREMVWPTIARTALGEEC